MSNVRAVGEMAYMPDPLYARKPLEWFVGRVVKMAFQSANSRVEHMWVKVEGISEDGHGLVGVLVNEPATVTHLVLGDKVQLNRTQIEAVELSLDEWVSEVVELTEKKSYANPVLGDPAGPLFLAAYYESLSPRQALRRWRNFKPRSEDVAEETYCSCGEHD